MCEFISWIEKDGQVYYLTYKDIYRTKRGKELREYCIRAADYIGHGAIRYFYDSFEGGTEKECADFSTPKNFPDIIVEAIKNNEMSFLATIPVDLLKKKVLIGITAYAEWRKADAEREKAYAEWRKAYAEREKAYAEWEKADAEWRKAYAEWRKAYAEREKAYAEWEKADVQKKAWKLFRIKENRNPLWR